MQKIKLACIVLLLSFLISSCREIEDLLSNPKTLKVICLIDFSESVPTETMDNYKTIISNNIMRNIGIEDEIIVLPLDYGSITSSEEILAEDFGSIEFDVKGVAPQQKSKYRERNFSKHLDSILVYFDSNFESVRLSRKDKRFLTDIFGSLEQALKYRDDKENKNLLIVIFSDMLHETNKINLRKELNKRDDIEKLLTKAMPVDFNGTEIYVLTGNQPSITIEKFTVLKEFWEKYFLINNAKLINYDSGSVTLLEKRISSSKK